jgi:hypothetical protein
MHKKFAVKLECKTLFGEATSRLEDNIKMGIIDIGCDSVD